MDLVLPRRAVPDRVSRVQHVAEGQRAVLAELDGPGCIRHLFLVLKHPRHDRLSSRRAVLRLYFDDSPVPQVEAPAGDFFGVMHGEGYYDLNSKYLSVKAWNGYNCYFPMPFARHARLELEAGAGGTPAYLMVDWHRYPDEPLAEPRRFCARWRHEQPSRRYAGDFLLLDADGPGQLLGFVYGVRLLDDTDRWSHGGGDNLYVDGEGRHPAYVRGIGGEDTFGAGYGGNLHPPDSHWYDGMPFYTHDDQGTPRPAPRLVGYRFYDQDAVAFEESLQFRFGCMENDISSTVYWYQEGPLRPFVTLPAMEQLLPSAELRPGACDLPLPDRGGWLVAAPLPRAKGAALPLPADALPADLPWVPARAHHGFVDFNHYAKPRRRGSGVHHTGVVGLARCTLTAPAALTATLQLAWDDELALAVNDAAPQALGAHAAFRARQVAVPLRAGPNRLALQLSNESSSNHGGWCFACRCTAPDGTVLLPQPA